MGAEEGARRAAQLPGGRQPRRPAAGGDADQDLGPDHLRRRRLNDSYDDTVRAHIAEIPEALDHIDRWIAEGVLGGAQPNAADFQIAPSVRLLMTFDDLRPAIEDRPAGQHAQRFLPEAPGRIPPVFPAEWLEPLRAGSPT